MAAVPRFDVVPRTEVDPDEWDALADRSDDAWLWHRWHLAEALDSWHDVSDQSFALRDGDRLVALVPLRRTRYRRARRLWLSRLDSLGGIATDPTLGRKVVARLRAEAIEELCAVAAREGDVEIAIAMSPLSPALRGDQAPKVNPLLELGFEDVSTQTWIVDLTPGAATVLRGFKQRARRAISKAEGIGVEIREASGEADLETYCRLHEETYERTGAPPHPRRYFEAIWEHFVRDGLSIVLFAEHDGEVVAARNFGVYKGSGIYWTGASNQTALDLGANHLLQWRGMQWMIEHDIRWSESGEAFPAAREGKSKGLSYFKESFGGELNPYFRGRIVPFSRLHSALEGFKQIRRAVSR